MVYTFSTLLVIVITILFDLITIINLLFRYELHYLLKLSELFSYMLTIINIAIIDKLNKNYTLAIIADIRVEKMGTTCIKTNIMGNVEFLKSDISKS